METELINFLATLTKLEAEYLLEIFDATLLTVYIWLASFFSSLIIVLVLFITSYKFKGLGMVYERVFQLIKSIPFLLLTLSAYYGFSYSCPQLFSNMNEYLFGYIILTIYGVAHMAISHQDMREKIVRANNAALSLGMGTYVRLYRIILPLVLHQNWWVFYNEAIFLFKNIAILSVIAIPELVATAKHIVNDTYLAINTYVTIAIICLFLVASMKGAFIVLHKLLFKH